MLCGKIASGKSTMAARLARPEGTVLISEDAGLNALYPGEMAAGADYLRCSERLRRIMAPHIASLLGAGLSVVLDFPANTAAQRAWMRWIVDRSGAAHRLHLLDVPDAVCLARLRDRNTRGDHPLAVTEAQFHQFTRHFAAPSPEEGFQVVLHDEDGPQS